MKAAVIDQYHREGWVKILFELTKDEDDFPPVSQESLWARPVPEGYEIDNIPFFVRSISSHDIVSADERDGALVFRDLARPSGHSTVRIVPYDRSGGVHLDIFEQLGCSYERHATYGLIAVDVPPSASYARVRAALEKGATEEQWDFEEGTVADNHRLQI